MRKLMLVVLSLAVFCSVAMAQSKIDTKWHCPKATTEHKLDCRRRAGSQLLDRTGRIRSDGKRRPLQGKIRRMDGIQRCMAVSYTHLRCLFSSA